MGIGEGDQEVEFPDFWPKKFEQNLHFLAKEKSHFWR